MMMLVRAILGAALISGAAYAASLDLKEASAGMYDLEKSHASLIWRVSHQGLSHYTARFTDLDATLRFDPEKPENSQLRATVHPASVRADHPSKPAAWDDELANDKKWFNAKVYPTIDFVSTRIRKRGRNRGKVTGNLTFLGVTAPLELDVTFNGVHNFPWFGQRDSLGFSARGTIRRSDFGMTALIPGIGDTVEIIIEAEFLQRSESPEQR